ncbi:MAG: MvaI/BcnI family restriction endonuclease [Bacteroidota bacterium]
MNPIFKPTPSESILIDKINEFNNSDFALIRMTETMLIKSTIDASNLVRIIFKKYGIVDYSEVVPGGEKLYKKGVVILNDVHEHTVSYYRPKSKTGDPRFWVYKLQRLVEVGTLIYFTVLDDNLIVIPLTKNEKLEEHLNRIFPKPEDENATLLLLKAQLLKIRQGGWIRSISRHLNAPKDVGETLENFIGIPINNLKTPDFLGKIELKSKRDQVSTLDSLFSRVPDWDISNYKSVYDIVNKFGYINEGDVCKRLYNDIKSTPNTQGLYLSPDDDKSVLYQKFSKEEAEDEVCAWRYETVKNQLETKHPSTLWVGAEQTIIDGEYYFKYTSFELSTRPLFTQFITLIRRDKIIYDWKARIKPIGKAVRNHGPGFRIKPKDKKLLFKSLIDFE